MDPQDFETRVNEFVSWSENAQSARQVLLRMYDLLVEYAQQASRLRQGSKEWCLAMFKIHQALTWTPLRYFWEDLVGDEHVEIRVVAKDMLAQERMIIYSDDEQSVAALSNLFIKIGDNGPNANLVDEICMDQLMVRALAEWGLSTQGIRLQGLRFSSNPPQVDTEENS